MDKNYARQLVKETFENHFDKDRFTVFIKNLLNNIDESKSFHAHGYIQEKYKQTTGIIKTYERIGTYVDPEENKIDILIVYLQKEDSIDRARTSLRNFAADYLKNRGEKDAGLIAFVSPNGKDWRFSFVKMEYELAETPLGRIKVKEEFTPARRYSYLVGEGESSHTAQSRLAPVVQDDVNNPTLKQLEEAFNIEKVTTEFFEKYRELFLWVKDKLDEFVKKDQKIHADFERKQVDTVDFAKKLLGQIVFLYFLQKKGWFGVPRGKDWGEGDKKFLRSLFLQAQRVNKNYFNKFLEPLFYEALRLERPKDYYDQFECRIPFLNGGLFDPINDYDWQDTDIELPNNIFSNDRKTKEGDTGDGILDIFDRYNFTVKEDEPLEKEVAVDPEMLGKVFENLLEVKDRKSKGTYYTPREIVHYMCRESLANYLVTELENKASKEDIETLIKYGESVVEHESRVVNEGRETKDYSFKIPKSIRKNAQLLDDKLKNIRVCDPAIGSGAFPVGMMNEIIRTRNTLTNYMEDKKDRSIYSFKRNAIQNSLYGVDIDLGAVEIAKLRLWLSLIVDEEERETIQPLPNLDYKIMRGNSLLGIEKEKLGMRNMFFEHQMTELEELKRLHTNEATPSKKKQLKDKIDELISSITNGHKDFDFEVYFSEVFHEKGGFDVVIANPPYIGEKGHKEIFREVKNGGSLGKFYQGKMDLFYFFLHLALNLGKENSNVTFITTNYFPTATGAKKLRQDFKERAIIKNLNNFNELKIFESALGQHNMITILEKAQNENAIAQTCVTQRQGTATPEILQQILNGNDTETRYYKVAQKDLYDGENCDIRLSGTSIENHDPIQTTLSKIKSQGELLGTICNVNQGIVTGADKVSRKHIRKYKVNAQIGSGIFVLSDNEINDLKLTIKEMEILKPWFKNSDVHRWNTNINTKEKLIFADKRLQNLKDNKLQDYLMRFKKILDNSTSNSPYLHRPRDIDFINEKIVAPQRSPRNTFGYNKVPWYASADVYFITEKDKSVFLKYVLALLNSRLYYLWLYHRGKLKGEALELYQKPLSEIPIKKISEAVQEPFIEIVDKILAITKDKDYLQNSTKQAQVREYEKQIDKMVYKLYGLTPEEIKIVENKV
jgi:hypothetical protein